VPCLICFLFSFFHPSFFLFFPFLLNLIWISFTLIFSFNFSFSLYTLHYYFHFFLCSLFCFPILSIFFFLLIHESPTFFTFFSFLCKTKIVFYSLFVFFHFLQFFYTCQHVVIHYCYSKNKFENSKLHEVKHLKIWVKCLPLRLMVVISSEPLSCFFILHMFSYTYVGNSNQYGILRSYGSPYSIYL